MSVKNKPIRIATAETTTSENELLALGAADISRYKQKETKEQRPAQDQLTFFFHGIFFLVHILTLIVMSRVVAGCCAFDFSGTNRFKDLPSATKDANLIQICAHDSNIALASFHLVILLEGMVSRLSTFACKSDLLSRLCNQHEGRDVLLKY